MPPLAVWAQVRTYGPCLLFFLSRPLPGHSAPFSSLFCSCALPVPALCPAMSRSSTCHHISASPETRRVGLGDPNYFPGRVGYKGEKVVRLTGTLVQVVGGDLSVTDIRLGHAQLAMSVSYLRVVGVEQFSLI